MEIGVSLPAIFDARRYGLVCLYESFNGPVTSMLPHACRYWSPHMTNSSLGNLAQMSSLGFLHVIFFFSIQEESQDFEHSLPRNDERLMSVWDDRSWIALPWLVLSIYVSMWRAAPVRTQNCSGWTPNWKSRSRRWLSSSSICQASVTSGIWIAINPFKCLAMAAWL